jgi:ribonuclease T2
MRGLAAALAWCLASPSLAQSFTTTPCVLDKCLNGGAASAPRTPAPEADAPANTPQAPRPAGPIAPGDFDFYLLTLSWSPGFCATPAGSRAGDQCAAGSGLGFVVHGLWPQNQHGYPSDCDKYSRAPSRVALQEADGVYPSEGLARYEWRKHGTCTGLSPQAYFASARRARDSIAIPNALKAPTEQQSMSPRDIVRAFTDANRGLRADEMAITCSGGQLQDVRICLSKDLRQPIPCPEVARQICRASRITVAPLL